MRIRLNQQEISELMQAQTGRGGFQTLVRRLQRNILINQGSVLLDRRTLEKIIRYAFGYRNGGWQIKLRKIFGRTLRPLRAAA